MPERMDALKTQLQETGRCSAHALSVAETVEILEDLGLDPRHVGIYGGFGASYLAIVEPYERPPERK